MALYREDSLTVDMTPELKIMLLMHIENIGVEDGDSPEGVSYLTEKGAVMASAVQSLALHKNLYRFANEIYQAGVDAGSAGMVH